MNKLLAIIDAQYDFVDGALGSERAKKIVVPNIVKKLKNHFYKAIAFTQDRHFEDYLTTREGHYLPVEHCIWNTPGCGIIEEVMDAANQATFNINFLYKNQFGTFDWTDYSNYDFDEIEIIGLVTDICVISNALILRSMYPEVKITIDASCCAGTTPEKHRAALDVMKSCHIEVINDDLL